MYSQSTDDEKLQLKAIDSYAYSNLELKYGQKAPKDIASTITLLTLSMLLFHLFSFLFVYGLIEMIAVSFYKRVL